MTALQPGLPFVARPAPLAPLGSPSEPATRRPAHPAHPAASADAAVAEAFDIHAPRIRSLMLAATRDPEVAEDVTQEAFLRLLREAREGRMPDNPGGWLYRAASNLAISRARRAAVARRFAPALPAPAADPQPEAIALEGERARVVRMALTDLSDVERTAVVLAAEGLSGEEIADRLGKSHAAVRSLIYRARTRLRRSFQASGLAADWTAR